MVTLTGSSLEQGLSSVCEQHLVQWDPGLCLGLFAIQITAGRARHRLLCFSVGIPSPQGLGRYFIGLETRRDCSDHQVHFPMQNPTQWFLLPASIRWLS